jgi:uncharacterized protein (TIGR02145 family)
MRNEKFEMKNGRKNVVACVVLFFAAIAFALTACTVYDNYDIELMQDPVALLESSSSTEEDVSSNSEESETKEGSSSSEKSETKEKSSSSKGKDTTYVVIVGQSSDSKEPSGDKEKSSSSETSPEMPKSSSSAWPCGDSSLVMKDGAEYKTVLINNTCWMAENMRNTTKTGKSVCYSDEDFPDEDTNCAKYGRLYNNAAAEAVCPSGWRLPDSTDFKALYVYLKSDDDYAGYHLKADHGWEGLDDLGENGDDMLGFAALPGGLCSQEDEVKCSLQGDYGYWWSSSPVEYDTHVFMVLVSDDGGINYAGHMVNDSYLSVRCIKK